MKWCWWVKYEGKWELIIGFSNVVVIVDFDNSSYGEIVKVRVWLEK